MAKKQPTNPDTAALQRIIETHDEKEAARRALKDANSAKLQEPKEAMAELEEAIKAYRDCDPGEAPSHLATIQAAQVKRRQIIDETAEAWRQAKKEFEELEGTFNTIISEAKQGELPLEEAS